MAVGVGGGECSHGATAAARRAGGRGQRRGFVRRRGRRRWRVVGRTSGTSRGGGAATGTSRQNKLVVINWPCRIVCTSDR